MLAEAALAVLLDRLVEVGRAYEVTVGELIGRVEDAVGALADPEAVAEALAGGRAEAARQVAEAEERAVRAGQAKSAAETAARDATPSPRRRGRSSQRRVGTHRVPRGQN